jgi:hypothetical protein
MNELMIIAKGLLKGLLLAYFITRFEPMQWLLNEIKDTKYSLINIIINSIKLILSCSKCFSFWVILISSKDLYVAIIGSLTMSIIEKYILSEIEKIEFKH